MTWGRTAMAATAVMCVVGTVFAATPLGRDLMFHVLPLRWTGEAERVAAAVNIGPGATVADLGAGSGALVVELARIVGPRGRALASERSEGLRSRIAERAKSAGVAVAVVAGADRATNLPDACCDAITMRMVMHHIADREAFARDVRRAVRPGGRIAIIDFLPGALPHLAADHGVDPADVVAAFSAAGFQVVTRDDAWGGRNYLIVLRPR